MDAEMFTEYEAWDGEMEEFRSEDGEWENIQAEDAHLEDAYERRYSAYDEDLLDLEDFGSQYDCDPNVYDGTYSED